MIIFSCCFRCCCCCVEVSFVILCFAKLTLLLWDALSQRRMHAHQHTHRERDVRRGKTGIWNANFTSPIFNSRQWPFYIHIYSVLRSLFSCFFSVMLVDWVVVVVVVAFLRLHYGWFHYFIKSIDRFTRWYCLVSFALNVHILSGKNTEHTSETVQVRWSVFWNQVAVHRKFQALKFTSHHWNMMRRFGGRKCIELQLNSQVRSLVKR